MKDDRVVSSISPFTSSTTSAALRLHVKNPGFITIRKSDVFVCKMFKLLTTREESG